MGEVSVEVTEHAVGDGPQRDAWSGVELRHLAALAAIERAGSFRRAADELGYVQSAVSQQIARLEAIVGVRLVERRRGHMRVALTPAGRSLLGHAQAITARLALARADLERVAEGGAGALRVGACESAATRIVPHAIGLLRGRLPHAGAIELSEPMTWQATRRLVLDGEADVAIDYLPLDADLFDHAELMAMPVVLVVPAASPLLRREEPLTLPELAALPLVEHPTWRFSPRLEVILQRTGHAPQWCASAQHNGAVQAMVASGVGVAVMPKIAVEPTRGDVAAIDLSEILPPARLVAFWRKGRPHHRADAFVEVMRQVCADLRQACAQRQREATEQERRERERTGSEPGRMAHDESVLGVRGPAGAVRVVRA